MQVVTPFFLIDQPSQLSTKVTVIVNVVEVRVVALFPAISSVPEGMKVLL